MKRILWALILGGLIWGVGRAAGSEGPPPESASAALPDTGVVFGIEAGSRLYPDWKETHRVHRDELFYLGDSPMVARVKDFLPDFRIIDGKPRSVSDTLGNPAVHVFVYADSGAVDSVWAFLNFPPHYSERSFFTFRLTGITGLPQGPVVPPDPARREPGTPAASKAEDGKP